MLRRWDRHDLVVNSETVSPREFRSASGRTGRIGSWHGYPLTSGSRYMDLFPWRPSPEDTPHLVCAKHGRIPWPANESAQFRAAPKGSIRVRRVIVSATVE